MVFNQSLSMTNFKQVSRSTFVKDSGSCLKVSVYIVEVIITTNSFNKFCTYHVTKCSKNKDNDNT